MAMIQLYNGDHSTSSLPYFTITIMSLQTVVPGRGVRFIIQRLSFAWLKNYFFDFIYYSSQGPFWIPNQTTKQRHIFLASWLIFLLHNHPEKRPWSKAPMQSSLSHGSIIIPTSNPLVSHHISISTISFMTENTRSSELSATPSERVDFILKHTSLISLSELEPPWKMYHMPLSWLTSLIPNWMEMGNLPSFYKGNYKYTELQTSQKCNK